MKENPYLRQRRHEAYAVPLSNVAMDRGLKRTHNDLLDISGIHMAVEASHEMN